MLWLKNSYFSRRRRYVNRLFSASAAVLATIFSTAGSTSERPWKTSGLTLTTGDVMAAAFELEEDHSTLTTLHLMLHQTHMAYFGPYMWLTCASMTLPSLAHHTVHGHASPLTHAARAAAPHEPLGALSRLNSQRLTAPCNDVLRTTRR